MTIKNRECGEKILLGLIQTIHDNAAYLSEIDGKIGDGDHGINMNKGFTLCAQRLNGQEYSLSEGLAVLSQTLMEDIGGSMGPLYGSFFIGLSETLAGHLQLDAELFGCALEHAVCEVESVGSAKVGDKTLMDTLMPASDAYRAALTSDKDFNAALMAMIDAAEKGWLSTKDLQARIGRASRLGERSIGVLDAGATSCYLLLRTLGTSLQQRLG